MRFCELPAVWATPLSNSIDVAMAIEANHFLEASMRCRCRSLPMADRVSRVARFDPRFVAEQATPQGRARRFQTRTLQCPKTLSAHRAWSPFLCAFPKDSTHKTR